MRVLHLISSGGMYGAEAVILNLCRTMNAQGADRGTLGVFAHGGQAEPVLHTTALEAGIASERVPCQGQFDRFVGQQIRALAQRLGGDVIHAHGYKADVYTAMAFAGRSRPALVSTCHTWYDNDLAVRLYGTLDRLVLRTFDEVIAVSREVQERLLVAGVNADRVHLIRNGVSLGQGTPGLAERPPKEAGAALRVGLVGRLAPEKGVDLFLRAAAKLAPRFPGVSFLVAGEGPERASLEGLLRSLGLEGRAALLGEQKEMGVFYRSLDLLVSASRQEGLPMAMLEGMACGLPVVATRVGEVPQVVAEGRTGFLVAPGSAEALAEAMAVLLSDPEKRAAFGSAGKDRIQTQFSAERMTQDYLDVYRRAAARHGEWRAAKAGIGASA